MGISGDPPEYGAACAAVENCVPGVDSGVGLWMSAAGRRKSSPRYPQSFPYGRPVSTVVHAQYPQIGPAYPQPPPNARRLRDLNNMPEFGALRGFAAAPPSLFATMYMVEDGRQRVG